ncbi:MAG: phospholipase/carboxylesterase [Kiritimatiellia bacterium]|jgi:phospholipase/carboxylesterase
MPLAHLSFEPAEPVIGAVIWMHGLGASCRDFVPLLPFVMRPGLRFIFPQAPERPVTVNAGERMPSWYDIRTMEPVSDRENLDDVHESSEQIRALIDAQVEAGVPSDRIVLAGFSQGAALALWTAHRYAKPLRAMLIMSGYQLGPDLHDAAGHPANANTPAMCMHGMQDQVVAMDRGYSAYDVLSEGGRETTWRDYPMGHELCALQARELRQWFESLYV